VLEAGGGPIIKPDIDARFIVPPRQSDRLEADRRSRSKLPPAMVGKALLTPKCLIYPGRGRILALTDNGRAALGALLRRSAPAMRPSGRLRCNCAARGPCRALIVARRSPDPAAGWWEPADISLSNCRVSP
jgi:hypothetical protein